MSIASEITRISGNVADAYTAANAKGATMPVTQNSDNLATTISTIQTGTTPTGTKSITANGVYDVTDFASADVQVPTTAPAYYIEKTKDANNKLVNTSNIINLSGITDIGDYVLPYAYTSNTSITGALDLSGLTNITGVYACTYAFKGCRGITSVDLSSLKKIGISTNDDLYSCNSMFSGCTGITGILDLSNLEEIGGNYSAQNMFANCTGITQIKLDSLSKVDTGNYCWGNMFYGCSGITGQVIFPSLKSVGITNSGQQFYNCINITSAVFPVLEKAGYIGSMFYGCTGLVSLDLSSLVSVTSYNALQSICYGCTNLTTVKLDSVKGLSNYSSVFNQAFRNCTSLTTLSFPAIETTSFGSLTGAFNNMCQGITNIALHFPSNVQSVIEGLQGYSTTAPFGAVAGTVLFDLPATVLLTGANTTQYQRNPKYDTGTALAWRVKDSGTTVDDWTPFYTSGLTDPTVGTTIYSDSACTTSVTTVDSIA